jgi:DNA-binding LacI/PurR family transcriptional regulator
MSSIKDIAKLAQVSLATASFVLNGKGEQMRISEPTQQKILEAAKTLNYRPNISAKHLRSSGGKAVPVIAILWTLDTRASLIGRFLKGIEHLFSHQTREFELLIHPYENSKIDKVQSLVTGTRFNGAIIAYASESDLVFLENSGINMPIVLYQRDSHKYSSVKVNFCKTGMQVAKLFADRGHKNVGIVVPDLTSQSIDQRKEGFLKGVSQHQLRVNPKHIIVGPNTGEGGYNAVKELSRRGKLPTAVFFINDTMAAGGLAAFHEAGIRIPEDIEVMGHDNHDHSRFTIPSLSTVHLPEEEMAVTCVNTLLDLLNNKVEGPVAITVEATQVIRQSCGGVKDIITKA